MPNIFKYLPKGWNFAKSGHIGHIMFSLGFDALKFERRERVLTFSNDKMSNVFGDEVIKHSFDPIKDVKFFTSTLSTYRGPSYKSSCRLLFALFSYSREPWSRSYGRRLICGLVVLGGDSCSKCREFKSQRCTLICYLY